MEKRVIGGQCRRLSREECERKEGRKGGREEGEGRKKERRTLLVSKTSRARGRGVSEKRDGRGGVG